MGTNVYFAGTTFGGVRLVVATDGLPGARASPWLSERFGDWDGRSPATVVR